MEEYKNHLCTYIKQDCVLDTIYECIKDDSSYECNLNEGKLHSEYMGSYYKPAIIHTGFMTYTEMFWLFDGEIKDCLHPFYIRTIGKRIDLIVYYSSERIKTNQAIYIYYDNTYNYVYYNTYSAGPGVILQNTNYKTCSGSITGANKYDRSLFTPKFYPLCDEMDTFKLKFVD